VRFLIQCRSTAEERILSYERSKLILIPRITLPVIFLLLTAACATVKTPVFSTDAGAIRGYDPVAYHLLGQPQKGRPELSFSFNDSNWYFASESNLELFRLDPAKYIPQYGGYCAYAMSKNLVVSTDPEAWHIENGKLYLNYSLSVRETWLKDIPAYVNKADSNWQQKLSDH
jgi:YHS domain-containing protein